MHPLTANRAATLAFTIACGLAALTHARPAEGCAPAVPAGSYVTVASESAVIVWDEATHTEDFIRRASFRTEARDFGFLVPTPTKPELAEANDAAFAALERSIAPRLVAVERWSGVSFMPLVLAPFMMMSRSAAPVEVAAAGVTVLEEKRVAGYDAAVLEADSASALATWLSDHGYEKRPALEEWLVPYVEKKWKLTAFKIADGADAGGPGAVRGLGTSAVRMTFHTDRPFFPYREPRDQRESVPADRSSPRSLRVFFIAPGRFAGAIGAGAATWPGKTVWSGPPPDWATEHLPSKPPAGAWLTAFDDDASPRPGVDELYFSRASEQSPVEPPPVDYVVPKPVWIPLDVVAVVGGVATALVVRARRKKRRAEASEGEEEP